MKTALDWIYNHTINNTSTSVMLFGFALIFGCLFQILWYSLVEHDAIKELAPHFIMFFKTYKIPILRILLFLSAFPLCFCIKKFAEGAAAMNGHNTERNAFQRKDDFNLLMFMSIMVGVCFASMP